MPRGVPKSGKRKPRGSVKKNAAPTKRQSKLAAASKVSTDATTAPVLRDAREVDGRTAWLFSQLTQSVATLAGINAQNLGDDVLALLQVEMREQLTTLAELRKAVFGECASTQDEVAAPVAAAPAPQAGPPIVGTPLAQPGGIPQFAPPQPVAASNAA